MSSPFKKLVAVFLIFGVLVGTLACSYQSRTYSPLPERFANREHRLIEMDLGASFVDEIRLSYADEEILSVSRENIKTNSSQTKWLGKMKIEILVHDKTKHSDEVDKRLLNALLSTFHQELGSRLFSALGSNPHKSEVLTIDSETFPIRICNRKEFAWGLPIETSSEPSGANVGRNSNYCIFKVRFLFPPDAPISIYKNDWLVEPEAR